MKYLTLEGKYGVYYFYHFPLLNHFRNRELVCIPFFLTHALEEIVMDVSEKKKGGQFHYFVPRSHVSFILSPPGPFTF